MPSPDPVRRLGPHEAGLARDLRVAALTDAPAAFGSTVAREQGLSPQDWDERLTGSAWLVAEDADGPCGLVVHRAGDDADDLLSMWVAPRARGTGTASALVAAVLDRAAGRPVRLWVVEGNAAAERRYAAHGFTRTGVSAPLPSDPALQQVEMLRP